MPKNKDFNLRIEIIDGCLRNRQQKWTLDKLIENVNEKLFDRYDKTIKKRTIQDDLRYLKEEKNAPLEKKRDGKKTYFYYSNPTYSIINLPINDEEIDNISDAINILRQVNDFKLLKDVDEIISKLQKKIDTNLEKKPPIVQFEKHTIAKGSHYIDTIYSAIKMHVPLRISYQTFKNTVEKQFIFHSYLLKEYRNRWFLIGRKENEDTICNLALDRIKQIKNSKTEFIPNNLFDIETYFNNLIGVTKPQGEKVQTVEIKISKKQSPYALTKPIHHSQELIRSYKNGSILVSLKLICNYELRSVLLGFGEDVEVRKPLSLRNDIKEVLEETLKNYLK